MAFLAESERPKRRALVGGQSPPPPSLLGPARGRPLAGPRRLLVVARRLDSERRHTRTLIRSGPGSREYPGAPLAQQVSPAFRRFFSASRIFLAGRLGRVFLGLRPEHGAAVARDLHHQLALARVRPPPLRDDGHEPQQRPARAHHAGRRLAQQPPRLSELHATGLFLVGIDITYYGLKALSWVGIVKSIRQPPLEQLEARRIRKPVKLRVVRGGLPSKKNIQAKNLPRRNNTHVKVDVRPQKMAGHDFSTLANGNGRVTRRPIQYVQLPNVVVRRVVLGIIVLLVR